MKQEELADSISSLLGEAGIPLSAHQARSCAKHVLLMQDWNSRVNLTRITDIRQILLKHLLDSILPSRWLPNRGNMLDVGTGAGFPGIPIKIVHPELSVILLEAQRKKVSFLKVVLANLQMEGIRAVQARWESLSDCEDSAIVPKYDLVTMRAIRLSPDQLTLLARGSLRRQGLLAWWVGPSVDNDAVEPYNRALTQSGVEASDCITYHLPSTSRPRRICLWQKVE